MIKGNQRELRGGEEKGIYSCLIGLDIERIICFQKKKNPPPPKLAVSYVREGLKKNGKKVLFMSFI